MTQSRKWTKSDTTEAVSAYMAALEHPHKALVEALRRAVLGADPAIAEGIKWNAPSFRTHEYFATTHLRTKDGVGLILHLGARPRDGGFRLHRRSTRAPGRVAGGPAPVAHLRVSSSPQGPIRGR